MSRLLGIHGVPKGESVLVRTSSVHGHWLKEPIAVIWLDSGGRVLASEILRPWSTARNADATWALELRDPCLLPEGVASAILSLWPAH